VAAFSGWVIRRMHYKESSKIIYLYTVEGIVSVLVQGANRLNSPYLGQVEVGMKVRIDSTDRGLKRLKDLEVLDDGRMISQDLLKYTYVLHLFEIIDHVATQDMDHLKLYGLMEKVMEALKTATNYIPFIMMVESKLLYLLGLQPQFRRCIVCNSPDIISFALQDGGALCQEHISESPSIPMELARKWEAIYLYDFLRPSALTNTEKEWKQLREVIDRYYEYHLGLITKSRAIIRDLQGY
jgi:DNA repair protein RecO (recombination protein O)